jgi:HK97 gp10 family phage protein
VPGRYETHGRYRSRIPEITRKLDPAVNEATLTAAHIIVETARALVPKESGELMRAIHVERTVDPARGHGVDRLLTWVVAWSHDAFYGHFVEYGTVRARPDITRPHVKGWSAQALGKGVAQPFTAPRPFMVPAAEASRVWFKEEVSAAIRAACE